MPDKKNRRRPVLRLVILAVMAGAGILFYTVGVPVVLMVVQQAREASRLSQVENNLRQLELALHNYQQSQLAQQDEAAQTDTNPVGETSIPAGDPSQ